MCFQVSLLSKNWCWNTIAFRVIVFFFGNILSLLSEDKTSLTKLNLKNMLLQHYYSIINLT